VCQDRATTYHRETGGYDRGCLEELLFFGEAVRGLVGYPATPKVKLDTCG